VRIKQTPQSGIVLWELPHLGKGVWKMTKMLQRKGVGLRTPPMSHRQGSQALALDTHTHTQL